MNYPGMYCVERSLADPSAAYHSTGLDEYGEFTNDGLPRAYDLAEFYRVLRCAQLTIWGSGVKTGPRFVLPFERLDRKSALLTVDLRRAKPDMGMLEQLHEAKKAARAKSLQQTERLQKSGDLTAYNYALAFGQRPTQVDMDEYSARVSGKSDYDDRGGTVDPHLSAAKTWLCENGLLRVDEKGRSHSLAIIHESYTSQIAHSYEKGAMESLNAEYRTLVEGCTSEEERKDLEQQFPIYKGRVLQRITRDESKKEADMYMLKSQTSQSSMNLLTGLSNEAEKQLDESYKDGGATVSSMDCFMFKEGGPSILGPLMKRSVS